MQGPAVPKETAMQLYNLEHLELVRDPLTNTKCLVAWGQDTVLVAFRGTANKQNAIHDLKVGMPLWACAVLCCAGLGWAVLCCAVLCCAVLCCAVLCGAVHLVLVTKKGILQKKRRDLALHCWRSPALLHVAPINQ